MDKFLPNLEAAKAQARGLRADLAHRGQAVSHSQALELVARSWGKPDWNTLHAAIGNAPRAPVAVGQIVPGRYLKQAFLAEVTAVREISKGAWELVLEFDTPVDVVVFDSFSNFRRRVTKQVAADGTSVEVTSDGVPHLVLWG